MRLIDADALRIVTRGKNHHRKYVFADITDAPTIDAIPVEWLAQKVRIEDGWGNIPFSEYIKLLIWEWHQQEDEEQEAQDG